MAVRISNADPEKRLECQLAAEIEQLYSEPVVQEYVAKYPYKEKDAFLISNAAESQSTKSAFSSSICSRSYQSGEFPITLVSFPEVGSTAAELSTFQNSLLVFSINISRYNEALHEQKEANYVRFQIEKLKKLVETGYFKDVLLVFTHSRKFLVKLGKDPWTSCFPGVETPKGGKDSDTFNL
jgi:hypothetical protein